MVIVSGEIKGIFLASFAGVLNRCCIMCSARKACWV